MSIKYYLYYQYRHVWCVISLGKIISSKTDYTFDMLKILPDVKVYYNGQLVLPSKEIEIFTSDYKDPWIYKVLKKISGEPYAIDFSN